MRLRYKLAIANLLFKLIFVGVFLLLLPFISERINIYQTDDELIEKRELFFDLISEIGVAPFLLTDSTTSFGSYNILKEEFISLEKREVNETWNFIEITQRKIEGEIIAYRVLNYSFKVDGEPYLLEIGKSLASISITENNIRKIILIFLIAFLVLSSLFELVYTRTLIWPLDLIISKIKNSSDPSSFNRTPVKTSTYDFVTLDATLIELMEKTDALFKKEKEITENISHELLTPISILRGNLENLVNNNDFDNHILAKFEEALSTLYRLKTLVNAFLLIARVESRQYSSSDNIGINQLLTSITDELLPLAEDMGVKIEKIFNDEVKLEGINQSLMFIMFYNVINNAIKNIVNDGVVKIITSTGENQLFVTIADNGTGINPEQMENLFMRFKKKNSADDKGTGIGLAITKSIADFHSIDIKVESNKESGTTFKFIFNTN